MPTTIQLRKAFPFDPQGIVSAILVFAAFVVTARIGQYIFFVQKSSPALIWMPVGISLAAVLMWGYRMWLPILLAQIVISPAAFAEAPLVIGAFSGIGYALQATVGANILRRFGFIGTFNTSRDAFLLVIGSLFIAVIAPTITALAQISMHVLPFTEAAVWTYWTRVWAGGVFSILVMTPLITTFYLNRNRDFPVNQKIEISTAFSLLVLSIYLLFWTTLPQTLTFPLIYFLCAMLFWISLRFGARSISMGIFLLAGIGIAGSIIMHPSPTVPVNFQLFADELFIILIAPIFLIFVAVTEERRATSEDLASNVVQLQEAMMRLNLEDKFKNEFIAILAHELRNPLASVMSALEVLAIESGLSGESTRMIDNAQQQTVAMRRLLDDLLDVARVTQQKFKLQKERVDLGSVLTRSIENTRQFIADKGHTFSLSLPPELIYLYADPIRLGQIIVNLLNNAAKYTLPGGRIELVSSINDTNIMIEVRDNGIGIPQAELQNIFQPFNQLPGTVRLESGLGIGLSLTRRLVEMHEGTIEAVSQGVGKGSTFVIKLPLIEVPVATVSPIQLPVPVKKGLFTQRPVKTPYNILVVDDNESAAQGLGKLLQHNGHQVTLAHTGEHALEISRTITPEIMLLDIGLPDISGYEVAKELRSRNEFPLTLIALTGYGQDEDKKRAVAAGFNFHLTKPVSIKDVETLLQSV